MTPRPPVAHSFVAPPRLDKRSQHRLAVAPAAHRAGFGNNFTLRGTIRAQMAGGVAIVAVDHVSVIIAAAAIARFGGHRPKKSFRR